MASTSCPNCRSGRTSSSRTSSFRRRQISRWASTASPSNDFATSAPTWRLCSAPRSRRFGAAIFKAPSTSISMRIARAISRRRYATDFSDHPVQPALRQHDHLHGSELRGPVQRAVLTARSAAEDKHEERARSRPHSQRQHLQSLARLCDQLPTAPAIPLSYQLAAQPSPRSIFLIGGSFTPDNAGPGSGGFDTTNLQLSTPFGQRPIDSVRDRRRLAEPRAPGKQGAYTSRIRSELLSAPSAIQRVRKARLALINILALPTQGATFAIGQAGPIIPTNFNF